MTRSRARVVSALLLFHVAGAAPVAAQTPPPPRPAGSASAVVAPLAESLTGPAKAAYDQGRSLFQDGDFAGAASKFKQSYDLSKEPRLLWNLAVCEKNLHHYYRVQVLLQQYLREAHALLTPENRSNVEEMVAAIKNYVGIINLDAQPPDASVRIDGTEVARTPLVEPLPMDLGKHVLTVEKEGFFPFEKTLEVMGGTEQSLEVRLAARPTSARLTVVAAATDAIVVDGGRPTEGRWSGVLEPGRHHVRITGQGKKPYDSAVDLAPNRDRTLNVTLEKPSSKAWPWIAVSAVAVVGAGVGAYFIFKPEDRTADPVRGTLEPGVLQLPP